MNANLKRKIMFRVYLEYTKNLMLERPDYFMLGIFAIFSLVSISIIDVLTNTTGILRSDTFAIFGFLLAAIKNTSLIIQIFLAGFVVRVAIASARSIFKNLNFRRWNLIRLKY